MELGLVSQVRALVGRLLLAARAFQLGAFRSKYRFCRQEVVFNLQLRNPCGTDYS
jgi:hypothetical protein